MQFSTVRLQREKKLIESDELQQSDYERVKRIFEPVLADGRIVATGLKQNPCHPSNPCSLNLSVISFFSAGQNKPSVCGNKILKFLINKICVIRAIRVRI
jgi:hypothetical protein